MTSKIERLLELEYLSQNDGLNKKENQEYDFIFAECEEMEKIVERLKELIKEFEKMDMYDNYHIWEVQELLELILENKK